MTAALLREFMPYGAPELQDAARPHMVRALLLSSAIASLAFALAWGLSLVHLAPPATRDPVAIVLWSPALDFEPPPAIAPARPAPPPPVARSRTGVPVAVEDEAAPADVAHDAPPPGFGATGGTGNVDEPVFVHPTYPGDGPVNAPGEHAIVDQMPGLATEVRPDYPSIAQEAGVEGLVVVHALVGRDGRVSDVRLDPKAHSPLLDDAALEAARRWVFTPALTNGHPVAVWVAIPFRFTLRR